MVLGLIEKELIWYTDGSNTSKGTGAGVYCQDTSQKLGFSLEQYTTVFQAEVHAIVACVAANLDMNYISVSHATGHT
jgi:hypothetical protein